MNPMPSNHDTVRISPQEAAKQTPDYVAKLDPKAVQGFRDVQHNILRQAIKGVSASDMKDAQQQAMDEFDKNRSEYLKSLGLEEGSDEYLAWKEYLDRYSVDNMSDEEWYEGEDDEQSGHAQALEEFEAKKANTPTVQPETVEEPAVAMSEHEAGKSLEQLAREKHASYVRKINTKVFGKKRRQAMADYDAAEAAYSEALMADIARQLDDMQLDDMNDDQRNAAIKELADSQLKDDARQQYEMLLEQGGSRAKFLAEYEQWSLKKKLGFGALGAGVAVGLGFLGGAVGAGTATVTGGLFAYRFAQNHFTAKSRIYRQPSEETGFSYDASADAAPEQQIVSRMNYRSRYSIEQAERAKKRAVKVGLGAAALGGAFGAVGAVLHASDIPLVGTDHSVGLDDGHWKGGYLEHIDWDGDVQAADSSSPEPSAAPTPDGAETTQPDSPAPEAHKTQELDVPTYVVGAGEGWYETFGNLGVDSDHHAELLRQIGPELYEIGVATPHDGSWWVAAPGELPDEATSLILEAARDNGWHDAIATDAAAYSADTPEQVTSDYSVDKGEGLNEFVAEDYDYTLTHDQSMTLGAELEQQGAMYSSDYLQDNYGNPYGLSEPGAVSQATHDTIRDMVDDGLLNNSQSPAESMPTQDAPAPGETGSGEVTPDEVVGDSADNGAAQSDSSESTQAAEAADGLSAIEKNLLDAQVSQLIESGNYSILNDINYPMLQLEDLAAKLDPFTFTNETTPITEPNASSGEFGQGGYEFYDQPAGYAIPEAAREVIVEHIESLGLRDGDASTITGLLQNAA
jgi:hypothetical protein